MLSVEYKVAAKAPPAPFTHSFEHMILELETGRKICILNFQSYFFASTHSVFQNEPKPWF